MGGKEGRRKGDRREGGRISKFSWLLVVTQHVWLVAAQEVEQSAADRKIQSSCWSGPHTTPHTALGRDTACLEYRHYLCKATELPPTPKHLLVLHYLSISLAVDSKAST